MRDYGSEESLIKPKHANMGKMRNTETYYLSKMKLQLCV